MVQKQKRRRSSLIMGALLALLLGVAAGFFVLAMPIHMLETVTTFTRLSSLMIQAEPPISPNDKTLLAVLAGVFTAGIGWVLVDWLLFGRAGMRTLIREREDDYEDEEGDAFRPTDPLDLVAPPQLQADEWANPNSGDARRPLSARTDIGDPPKPSAPAGIQPMAMPGIDQLLPPIDQILPGVGAPPRLIVPSAPAPFPQPDVAPNPFQPGAQPPVNDYRGIPAMPAAENPFAPQRPADPIAPASEGAPAAPMSPAAGGAWLPTPGVRADGSLPSFETPGRSPEADLPEPELPEAEYPETPEPVFEPIPLPQAVPPLQVAPIEPPPPMFPPLEPRETAFAPPPDPFPPAAPEPSSFLSFAEPEPSVEQAAPPVAFDPPPAMPAAPPVQPAAPAAPAAAPSLFSEPGFDKARLEDLLVRLERGLEKRRAAQARAAAVAAAPPAVAPPVAQAPIAQPPIAEPPAPVRPLAVVEPPVVAPPPRFEPPASFTAPEPVAPPPFAMPQPVTPPAAFTAPQPVMPTSAPVYDLPPMPAAPAYTLAPLQPAEPSPTVAAEPSGNGDDLLDQPLHVTLELLRNKVKR